jgi:hypothetical protein
LLPISRAAEAQAVMTVGGSWLLWTARSGALLFRPSSLAVVSAYPEIPA